jgi:hypothetical protein
MTIKGQLYLLDIFKYGKPRELPLDDVYVVGEKRLTGFKTQKATAIKVVSEDSIQLLHGVLKPVMQDSGIKAGKADLSNGTLLNKDEINKTNIRRNLFPFKEHISWEPTLSPRSRK